jgi:hypothetical protein
MLEDFSSWILDYTVSIRDLKICNQQSPKEAHEAAHSGKRGMRLGRQTSSHFGSQAILIQETLGTLGFAIRKCQQPAVCLFGGSSVVTVKQSTAV